MSRRPETCRIRQDRLGEAVIAVAEKYAIDVNMPVPITSEHQHAEYLSVLDKLAGKEGLTVEEDKYAQVLMTLIEAYEEHNHHVPDAAPIAVLRALIEANDLRQKDLVPIFGSESIVSEVLNEKRGINKNHIEKLKQAVQCIASCILLEFPSLVTETHQDFDKFDRAMEDLLRVSPSRQGKAPAEAGAEEVTESGSIELESELGSKLNSARTASTQKRIADAHVAGRGDLVGAIADFLGGSFGRTEPATATSTVGVSLSGETMLDAGSAIKAGSTGFREVRVIQNVEEVRPKLHGQSLGQGRVLVDGDIPLFEGGATESVAAQAAVVAGPGLRSRRRSRSGYCW